MLIWLLVGLVVLALACGIPIGGDMGQPERVVLDDGTILWYD